MPEQTQSLISFLNANPGSVAKLEMYRKLHLKPELKLIYPGSHKLKKSVFLIPREYWLPAVSVAAAVVFMLVIYIRNYEFGNELVSVARELPA
jgi:hypothetical protein